MDFFSYKDGILHGESVNIRDLSAEIETPYYLYSASAFESRYREFAEAFQDRDCLICYAMKANSNQAVLASLAKLGSGADIVSQGELRRALAAGIAADKIVFSGVGKTAQEMDEALSAGNGAGILCFNIESKGELEILASRARALQARAPVSFRINPDIDAGAHRKISTGKSENKFGIAISDAVSLYEYAAGLDDVKVIGIDAHIGSQITSIAPFDAAFARLAELVRALCEKGREKGFEIEHIDLGGGLGVSYDEDGERVALLDYAQTVKRHTDSLNCRLIFEPGRFIAAPAGVLVSKVLYVKEGAGKHFIVLDAAMNDLMRPTLYDAHHPVWPIAAESGGEKVRADLVGPVCETGDYLGENRTIALPKIGDLLAFGHAGAYGAVQSGTYNSRLLVPEILVKGSDFHIVRPRPTYEDLIALDRLPPWLEERG